MQKKISSLFSVAILLILTSCNSYKNIPYFQDLGEAPLSTESIRNYSPLTIRAADILAINVTSRNPETSIIFNYNLNRVSGSYNISPDNPVVGYLVDDSGNINLPFLGAVKVIGLTTSQLQDKLREDLLSLYKDPVVNIRIVNFKVAVLGDVQRPDVYTLQNERTTITQALSLAGDLNITAKRTNVLLVRNEDGQRKFVRLNLTSKKLFQSPYYYLKNNDEIYVQPDKTKYATVDRGYRTSSLLLSGLSILAVILTNVNW